MTELSQDDFMQKYGDEVDGQRFENTCLIIESQERLALSNCEFSGCKIILKDVEQIEITECKFLKSVFCVDLSDGSIFSENCSFMNCNFEDVQIEGYSFQSEIIENSFSECNFSNIKIIADISILGGSFANIKFGAVEEKINIMMDANFLGVTAESVKIDCAIMNCTFDDVKINKLEHKGKQERNSFTNFVHNLA